MKRFREKCWKHNFLTLSFKIHHDQTTVLIERLSIQLPFQRPLLFLCWGNHSYQIHVSPYLRLRVCILPCPVLLLTGVVLVCQPGTSFSFQALNVDGTITARKKKKRQLMWCIKKTCLAAVMLGLVVHVCFYSGLLPFCCLLPAK